MTASRFGTLEQRGAHTPPMSSSWVDYWPGKYEISRKLASCPPSKTLLPLVCLVGWLVGLVIGFLQEPLFLVCENIAWFGRAFVGHLLWAGLAFRLFSVSVAAVVVAYSGFVSIYPDILGHWRSCKPKIARNIHWEPEQKPMVWQ